MARPLRIEIPNGLYHVTSRGLFKCSIVRNNKDREIWLKLLDRVARRKHWEVIAYVLMDTHFHIFLRTPIPNLGKGMHDLNSGYATLFNRLHDRRGPLFDGRYKSTLIEKDHHYLNLIRYIHMNPVKARMVKNPEDHIWSSCRAWFGLQHPFSWLACGTGGAPALDGEKIRRFHREWDSKEKSPLENATAGCLLGSEKFIAKMKKHFRGRRHPEIPQMRQVAGHPTPEEIIELVCQMEGADRRRMERKGRHQNLHRNLAIYLCRELSPIDAKELGAFFGCLAASTISHTTRITGERRRWEPECNQLLTRLEQRLGCNETPLFDRPGALAFLYA